jgi:phosphoglycolate phosphatase
VDPAWPRAALFDLDGTLIDSVPDITLAVGELMTSEDLEPFDEADVRAMVGHGLRVLVRRALAARGRTPDPAEFEIVIGRMLEIYPRHLTGRTTLLPGVVDCLDTAAAAGCAVALVTNKLQSAATTVLDHFELSDRFTIILGDQEGLSDLAPKPEPDMLLHALSHVGVEPAHAVMVGDSEADMASARAAGVFSVAVRGGYCDGPIEDLEPDVVIDSLFDFPTAVEAWRRRG